MHATVRSLDISPSGHISVDIAMAKSERNVYFDLPPGTSVHPDTIAICVALLLSKSCTTIDFKFPLSERVRLDIEGYCQAKVRANSACAPEPPINTQNIGLAFSGGFDSLAAKDFLPGTPELISLDFGGPFTRERSMFQQFGSTVIRTNLVETGFNRHAWTFMAVGNILMRSALGLRTLSFGTVTEARDKYLYRFTSQRQPAASALTRLVSMPIFNPILGLTEVATALYVSRAYPQMVDSVLASVANPGEDKSYRKALLVEAAASRVGGSQRPRLELGGKAPTVPWGVNVAKDFLSLYLIKHVGIQAVQSTYASAVPVAAEQLANSLALTFYERSNPNFYHHADPHLIAPIFANMISSGILPYSNNDFFEFSRVATYLQASRDS